MTRGFSRMGKPAPQASGILPAPNLSYCLNVEIYLTPAPIKILDLRGL